MCKTDLKEFTSSEVAKHNDSDSCWLIIGNEKTGGQKVYDVTKYLDEHPGGAEIMLESAGQDADDMFEDVGHTNDARKTMEKFIIGVLKLTEEEKEALKNKASKQIPAGQSQGSGLNPMVLLVLLAAIALGYYFTQMKGGEASS
eukprot:CAMPEP_0113936394 /NCGR_PEP_ID=MMETSP1339-20121228/3319_1 /TAXON_ID=94617 /ORGANISM="Fibrocapsa japonica" /LENGTH=143 /DNA_ID=CAMNT_0000938861 /DNA_START=130 /DNA_END=561 /DNA_ORIENTATION=- /assembly_acc=CAM_ASM_000762